MSAPPGKTRVRDTDHGAKAMAARLKALAASTKTVRVGVLSDAPKKEREGAAGKLSLVEVAAVHEFGAPEAGIPQRSFIRATIDERRGDIEALQLVLAQRVVEGKITEDQALAQLGAKVVAWVQARIASNIPPPLAEETAARKGSSVALVDTGQLRASIVAEVRG